VIAKPVQNPFSTAQKTSFGTFWRVMHAKPGKKVRIILISPEERAYSACFMVDHCHANVTQIQLLALKKNVLDAFHKA
jgi:hypothetical protein